jgi:hypothetical protein
MLAEAKAIETLGAAGDSCTLPRSSGRRYGKPSGVVVATAHLTGDLAALAAHDRRSRINQLR